MDTASFIRQLPKAELHLHIEGTLEPEMMFDLAQRNGIDLPYADPEEVRAAYEFDSLQSFLDLYYQGAAVLVTEQDFYDLMAAYLEKAHVDGVRRAEIFFDPQTHTERGIDFATFMGGFTRAISDAEASFGISVGLIMCFVRHLPPEEAVKTWHDAADHWDSLIAVGLDSTEIGKPPDWYEEAFGLARSEGLHAVAHAGEEGPPAYITKALGSLGAERIDHGVRCEEDPHLLAALVRDQIPLTMCPLSNVKLRVFDQIKDHNIKRLLDRGVLVTVNSDDPAYFGGYVADNYLAVAEAFDLTRGEIAQIARNSIEAAFIDDQQRAVLLKELEAVEALDG